jgi:hypothetical protein
VQLARLGLAPAVEWKETITFLAIKRPVPFSPRGAASSTFICLALFSP